MLALFRRWWLRRLWFAMGEFERQLFCCLTADEMGHMQERDLLARCDPQLAADHFITFQNCPPDFPYAAYCAYMESMGKLARTGVVWRRAGFIAVSDRGYSVLTQCIDEMHIFEVGYR